MRERESDCARHCKGTVFVVDDDDMIRATLAEVLEDEGYTVRMARNGVDALSDLRGLAVDPCVILLDLMMPVMDGIEFRSHQLQDARLSAIPVVVLSADNHAARKAAPLHVAAALSKPVELDDMLRALQTHCRCAAHASSTPA